MKKTLLFILMSVFAIHLGFSQTLLSSGKTAWASSENGAGEKAGSGNDGLSATRWESKHVDGSWWAVDLEKEYHIFRVEIDWETAYAKQYKIEIDNDPDFSNPIEIINVTNSPGGKEVAASENMQAKGRYVRLSCLQRATGYGCSFWEIRFYGMEELLPVPVKINVPYVQFLKMRLTPPDASGTNEFTVQNKEEVINLNLNEGTPMKIDLLDFRGNYDIDFWAYKKDSEEKVNGIPFEATVYKDMEIHLELTPKHITGNTPPVADAGPDITVYSPANNVVLDGSRSQDRDGEIISYNWEQLSGPTATEIENPHQAVTSVNNLELGDYKFRLTVVDNEQTVGTDDIIVSVVPPEQVDFQLTYPVNKAMVTDTCKPLFQWETCPDATTYEVYVNITRDDYEWYASGNLLDRYTKVGETTANSFVIPDDLLDRWTYKWYVIAHTTSGTLFSDKQQFGLYLPVIETKDDGVNMVDGCRDMNKNGTIEPYEDWRLTPEERLDDLMSRLTTEEKVRQLFYEGKKVPTEGFHFNSGNVTDIEQAQVAAAKTTRMGIPVATLGDNVHGFKTAYPTQIGLAATRDMDLIYRCANMQRLEHRYSGHTGTLGPIAEIGTKALYPRYQEGCGENADDGAAMIRAMICAMQAGPELNPQSMLVTVKHWPSQGAGGEGPTQYDDVTVKYHMKPWQAVVDANAASVMPGYGSSPYLDPTGEGACTSKPTIDYLRNEIGFKGFIVTDWLISSTEVSIGSIGVGIDVMGGSGMDYYNYDEYVGPYTVLDELVAAVGMDRINEAARRVLDAKIRMGMFENPYADMSCAWVKEDHQALAEEASRKAITLLKNEDVLPLKLDANDELIVGGPDHLKDSKEPHFIWHTAYADVLGPDTHLKAIDARAQQDGVNVVADNGANAKIAVVFIGEKSNTHATEWDKTNPNIPDYQLDIIKGYKQQGLKVVTVVISPRPYVLTEVEELSDALMLIYRGGNGAFRATAECLFGDFAPSGKLPYQLPKSQDQIGTDDLTNQIEKWDLPYDFGATGYEREMIRGYIERDEIVPPVFGDPLFQYGSGLQGFGASDETAPLAFDLVSPANGESFQEAEVTLTWEASSDPESYIAYYDVYVNEEKKASVTTTSYKLSGLEAGEYNWSITAVNGAGLEQPSNSIFAFTINTILGQSIQKENRITVYPNPFDDYIVVEASEGNDILRIKVTDVTGKVIKNLENNARITSIDMSAYRTGVYFLSVEKADGSNVFKLIKK